MAGSLEHILDRWRALTQADYNAEHAKGTAFEHLCKVYLENDPTEKEQYSDVQSFGDWARKRGEKATDTGIDLVACIKGASEVGGGSGARGVRFNVNSTSTGVRYKRRILIPS